MGYSEDRSVDLQGGSSAHEAETDRVGRVPNPEEARVLPGVSPGQNCPAPDRRPNWPDDLFALQTEWMSRQTEFLQGLLTPPAAHQRPAEPKPGAAGENPDQRAPDHAPMLDYLNQAYQINGEYVKRMIDAAPLVDEKAKESMRALTRDVVEVMAPTNFLAPGEHLAVSNYEEIRDELRSGDIIVASKGNMKSFNNFLSLLIRVFTASSYSHVGVVIKLGNRCFVVEATPPVVRLYPLSKLDSFYVIKMEETLTKDDENRLFEYVGMPYSDWNSVASYFTGKPLANGRLQCAQLVSSFYNWPNLLRPEQIVKYAQEKLGKRMVFVR